MALPNSGAAACDIHMLFTKRWLHRDRRHKPTLWSANLL